MGAEISCEKHSRRATLCASFDLAITETRGLVGASSSSGYWFTRRSYEIGYQCQSFS
jgi:hypothetical protein